MKELHDKNGRPFDVLNSVVLIALATFAAVTVMVIPMIGGRGSLHAGYIYLWTAIGTVALATINLIAGIAFRRWRVRVGYAIAALALASVPWILAWWWG